MPRSSRDILPSLIAPVAFCCLWAVLGYRGGALPVLADSSGFPYRLPDLSLGDILVFFEREPPLFLLYVKQVSWLFDPVFPALVVGNLLMMSAMLVMAYSFLSRYLVRGFTVAVCLFAAVGLEFFVFAIATRQEILTAFCLMSLLHAHATFFAPDGTGRGVRVAASLAIPALTVALVLTQPSYLTFGPLDLLALVASGFFGLLRRDLKMAAMPVWGLACAAMLSVPVLLMAKNQRVYDHFSLGSGGYEGLQRSVFDELRERYAFAGQRTFGRLLRESEILDDRVKQFYALGASWPTTRDEIRQAITSQNEYARLLRGWYPRKPVESSLYSHPESGNGYLFGPGMRMGYEVAQAILLYRPFDMVTGIAGRAGPLAVCYSSHWFFPAYGRRPCTVDESPLTVLLKPERILNPGGMSALQHHQSAGALARNLGLFLSTVPGPVTGLHLLLQRYLIWPLLALALLQLLVNLYGIATKREVDQVVFLLTALIVYSFLASAFLDHGGNMRWGIYYKLPLLCYLGYLLSRMGLGTRSR